MQVHQRLPDVDILESHALAHFDRRAAMVQPDNDDLFLHDLFEPPPVPAGKNRVAPEKVAENHTKADHRQQCGFLAS